MSNYKKNSHEVQYSYSEKVDDLFTAPVIEYDTSVRSLVLNTTVQPTRNYGGDLPDFAYASLSDIKRALKQNSQDIKKISQDANLDIKIENNKKNKHNKIE